jgi:hypothetical protein
LLQEKLLCLLSLNFFLLFFFLDPFLHILLKILASLLSIVALCLQFKQRLRLPLLLEHLLPLELFLVKQLLLREDFLLFPQLPRPSCLQGPCLSQEGLLPFLDRTQLSLLLDLVPHHVVEDFIINSLAAARSLLWAERGLALHRSQTFLSREEL